MAKLACVFPGQGSQSVGMGLDLFNNFAEAKDTYSQIDKTAGRALSTLCFEGPEAELKRTINTQPTILATALAAWACYEKLGGPRPDFVAGHSLGEITALVVAKVLSQDDAVKLVDKRSTLMENCPKGAMTAVLGMAPDALESLCLDASKAEEVVVVANFNTKDQLVISGNPEAVARAGALVKERSGKAIPLPVGGAFHSPLMSGAAKEFSQALENCQFADATCGVVQNFDAQVSQQASELKAKLAKQMESPVRWTATIEYLVAQGVDTIVEIGPGKVLAGLIKKIDRSVTVYNVSDSESLKATIAALQAVAQAV
ncbi:MAG: ACP S-malonyltransferase [Candidatus Obscuribacterales bacterium]